MGSRWDARLNGYIPMGDRNYSLGNQLGLSFTGHSQIGNIFQLAQYAGNGADVKLGYQLFPQSSLKGYVGSYFFNPSQTSNIWGGAAGLEYWIDSNVKVFASYTYDNLRHSTGAFGLGVELGGTHTERVNPTLEERITDPVERYLAELGRGSAIPSRKIQTRISQVVISNNIAFFSQTGGPNNGGTGLTLANCTFENPCGPTDLTDLGASTLNSLLPNTQMYFNGGAYDALNMLGGTSGVTLQSGQSVSSRTADYSQPATGAGRSTFNGALILNNNNTLNNIILLPTSATIAGNGITINNATNDVINGSQIGSDTNRFVAAGVNIANGQFVINTSDIFVEQRGVSALNSIGEIHGAEIDAFRSTGFSEGVTPNGSTIIITDSKINVGGGFLKNGINSVNNSIVTINNTDINVTSSSAGSNSNAISASDGTIEVNNGSLAATNTSTPANANIVFGGGPASISNTVCTLNGTVVVCP